MYALTKEKNTRGIELFTVYEKTTNKAISLNSKVSPRKEIEKFGKQIQNNKCYFIIGSGNGTLLEYLLEKQFHSKFYIIEIFREIDYEETYKTTLSNHQIYFYQQDDLSYLVISNAIREAFGMDIEILIHPNYDLLNKELLQPVLNKIKMGIASARINKNTEQFFMYDWLTEPILNLSLSENGKNLLEIKEKFNNKPVILVSSGPSLVDHLDFIRKNKNQAYIIASGSAVNGLVNHNIMPDFVTVMDAGKVNYTAHFKNTKYIGPIITPGTTNHLILKHHRGEIYFTNISQDTITKEVRPEFLMVPTVPSVAIYSLIIAHYLNASEIYLVGQDLALKNGEYYASGVHKHKGMENLGPIKEVEGNLGGKVVTTYPLATMLESFNQMVSLIKKENKSIQIYNLSEIGAKIDGVPYKDAREVVLENTIDKSWIPRKPVEKNIDYTLSVKYFEKIKCCKAEVDEVARKMKTMNSNAVTLQDLEKLLKLVKKLRENDMLETHILNMIYSTTKSINNMFEYGFDNQFVTNHDRVEMLNRLKFFVNYVQQYLEGLINQKAWSEMESLSRDHEEIVKN